MQKETHHDDAETTQERVYKSLSKEYTIRHVTYPGETLAADVFEANCIAHLLYNQEGFRIIKLAMDRPPRLQRNPSLVQCELLQR